MKYIDLHFKYKFFFFLTYFYIFLCVEKRRINGIVNSTDSCDSTLLISLHSSYGLELPANCRDNDFTTLHPIRNFRESHLGPDFHRIAKDPA